LAGVFIQSSKVAVHGVIAVVCGSLVALLLDFDKGLSKAGFFGYNSFLVRLVDLAIFDSPDKHQGYKASTIVVMIVFSSFTPILFVMLGKLLVPSPRFYSLWLPPIWAGWTLTLSIRQSYPTMMLQTIWNQCQGILCQCILWHWSSLP
jgi:urea transporter